MKKLQCNDITWNELKSYTCVIWNLERGWFAVSIKDTKLAYRLNKLSKGIHFGTRYHKGKWEAERFKFPTSKKKQILRILKEGLYVYVNLSV